MDDTPLIMTDAGLYCEAGDFYVDPWLPVVRAVVTHAHADHACRGSASYLTATPGALVLRARIGPESVIESIPYGQTLEIGGTRLSFHPAGHILGSAQVRIEHQGQICVVSGDYKVEPDSTCASFEPVRCHVFISESTFGLPIYRWPKQEDVFDEINRWWASNQESGKCSILFGYSLGKAQRMLAGLDPSIGPICCHGAVEPLNDVYRLSGVRLPQTEFVGAATRSSWAGAMIIAPPSAQASPWLRRFGDVSTAFASGWMMIRGTRRRRSVDRGFILSDHCDWPGLLDSIQATGAERVYVTHGYSAVLARWLREHGTDAETLATRFEGERDEPPTETEEAEGTPSDLEAKSRARQSDFLERLDDGPSPNSAEDGS
jgi:putative mRNA 3-end processing factor